MAELLKIKGLVEEEREKLLNTKDGRATEEREHEQRPRSSSASSSTKVNGDSTTTSAVGKDVSPPSTSAGPMVRPFMYTPPAGGPQFPMWPLPGIFPGAHNLFNRGDSAERPAGAPSAGHAASPSDAAVSSGGDKEGSPSPKDGGGVSSGSGNGPSSAKRKKTNSGNGSSSSKESGLGTLSNPDRKLDQDDRIHSMQADDGKDNGILPLPPGLDKGSPGIANYVPNQRLEWKRYKQYTRNDIMSAIEEVKKGKLKKIAQTVC